jgi:hypothetical protein
MKKQQLVGLVVVIMVMVICVVSVAYLFKDDLFSWTTTGVSSSDNNIKQPIIPIKPEFITLPDGSIVTGDFDKFLITESKTFSSYYKDHPEEEVFSASFTGSNIGDEILNSVTVTVRFYDQFNEFLSEKTDQTKYLPPDQEWKGWVERLLYEWEDYPDGSRGGMECDHVSYHITVS